MKDVGYTYRSGWSGEAYNFYLWLDEPTVIYVYERFPNGYEGELVDEIKLDKMPSLEEFYDICRKWEGYE
jgi:hypothetical protein